MFSEAITAGGGIAPGTDIIFPLIDAFGPVNKARIPVPGLNRWPGRYNQLGAKYYGLNAGADIAAAAATAAGTTEGGMSGIFDSFSPSPSLNFTDSGNNSGSIWTQIFGTIQNTLPATISAITGHNDPGYYGGGQPGVHQAPPGYVYDQSGNLISLASAQQAAGGIGVAGATAVNSISNFVAQNPLLVLGGTVAMILLFTRPPSRGR